MGEDSRTKLLTQYLKELDPKLFAKREGEMIVVYRDSNRMEHFEYEGQKYGYVKTSPIYILALTDNWTSKGRPVEWGIEPLMRKMRAIDSWNQGFTADDLIQSYEARDASNARDRINGHEAWLRDNRSMFKKAFNDINTSNLDVKQRERDLYGNL